MFADVIRLKGVAAARALGPSLSILDEIDCAPLGLHPGKGSKIWP